MALARDAFPFQAWKGLRSLEEANYSQKLSMSNLMKVGKPILTIQGGCLGPPKLLKTSYLCQKHDSHLHLSEVSYKYHIHQFHHTHQIFSLVY